MTDGLLGYPEWGVNDLTPDELTSWASAHFTRDNAALWIIGEEIPAGLAVSLPAGVRLDPPVMSAMLPTLPAYFSEGEGNVVLDMIVRRSSAARIMAGVLDRELFLALRQRGGLSYTAAAQYEPRDADHASVLAFADSLPEKRDAVFGELIDVVAAFRAGRIDPDVVESVKAKSLAMMNHPDVEAMMLWGGVTDRLMGGQQKTLSELREELDQVTVESVHEAALEALDTGVLQVPSGRDALWAGFAEAPVFSLTREDGDLCRAIDDPTVSLVAGQTGISRVSDHGTLTVLFDECEAQLRWPDGARRLIGSDGIALHIEPTLFNVTPEWMTAMDGRIGDEKVLHMPARDADDIPQPSQPAKPTGWFKRGKRRS